MTVERVTPMVVEVVEVAALAPGAIAIAVASSATSDPSGGSCVTTGVHLRHGIGTTRPHVYGTFTAYAVPLLDTSAPHGVGSDVAAGKRRGADGVRDLVRELGVGRLVSDAGVSFLPAFCTAARKRSADQYPATTDWSIGWSGATFCTSAIELLHGRVVGGGLGGRGLREHDRADGERHEVRAYSTGW